MKSLILISYSEVLKYDLNGVSFGKSINGYTGSGMGKITRKVVNNIVKISGSKFEVIEVDENEYIIKRQL